MKLNYQAIKNETIKHDTLLHFLSHEYNPVCHSQNRKPLLKMILLQLSDENLLIKAVLAKGKTPIKETKLEQVTARTEIGSFYCLQ